MRNLILVYWNTEWKNSEVSQHLVTIHELFDERKYSLSSCSVITNGDKWDGEHIALTATAIPTSSLHGCSVLCGQRCQLGKLFVWKIDGDFS